MPKVEDQIGKPLSPYAVTKYVNELYADVFARCYGFKTRQLEQLMERQSSVSACPKATYGLIREDDSVSEDFTEQRYGEILDLAASRFSFHPISHIPDSGTALWRHDIDFLLSVLLRGNNGSGKNCRCNLCSAFIPLYSVFEREVSVILQEIRAMGHTLGLHFDPSIYPPGSSLPPCLLERTAG